MIAFDLESAQFTLLGGRGLCLRGALRDITPPQWLVYIETDNLLLLSVTLSQELEVHTGSKSSSPADDPLVLDSKRMGRKDASATRTPVEQYRKQIGKQDYKKSRPVLRATRLKAEAKKTALGIKLLSHNPNVSVNITTAPLRRTCKTVSWSEDIFSSLRGLAIKGKALQWSEMVFLLTHSMESEAQVD
ncbi:unnamed protein product [Natator depressus]